MPINVHLHKIHRFLKTSGRVGFATQHLRVCCTESSKILKTHETEGVQKETTE